MGATQSTSAAPAKPIQLETIFEQTILHFLEPVGDYLRDPTVTEIMVNGPDQIYAERDGKLFLTDLRFRDEAHVLRIIDRIVSPIGRRIDEASPMVDARLPDGSRCGQ